MSSSLLHCLFYTEKYGWEYELTFSAWGEGVLSENDLLDIEKPDNAIAKFKKRFRRYPKSISLLLEDSLAAGCDYGYTGVDPALLEKLATLKELILPDSVAQIELTPALKKILDDNKTLIRGGFDSFAERFASENGLNFRPADCVIANYYFEPACESTKLSLVYTRDGKAFIKEDISSPGTSASNTFGGTFTHGLKKDFYKTMTAEQIAEQFSPRLRQAIIEDGRLAAFIEKARTHGYYDGKN